METNVETLGLIGDDIAQLDQHLPEPANTKSWNDILLHTRFIYNETFYPLLLERAMQKNISANWFEILRIQIDMMRSDDKGVSLLKTSVEKKIPTKLSEDEWIRFAAIFIISRSDLLAYNYKPSFTKNDIGKLSTYTEIWKLMLAQ